MGIVIRVELTGAGVVAVIVGRLGNGGALVVVLLLVVLLLHTQEGRYSGNTGTEAQHLAEATAFLLRRTRRTRGSGLTIPATSASGSGTAVAVVF